MATPPVNNGLRGRGGGCFGGMRFVLAARLSPSRADGQREAQRPESRLSPESTFAGPA